MRRVLVAAVLLAGCAAPPPAPDPYWVGPPEPGGGHAPCASASAQELAVPGLRASEVSDARGLGAGLHRVGEAEVLWVWAAYEATPRRDDVLRVNPVEFHREPDGRLAACTRVELGGEMFTDGSPKDYAVAVLFSAPAFPEGPTRWVVNWAYGCSACPEDPAGNATALFE